MATHSKPNTKIWKFLPLFFGGLLNPSKITSFCILSFSVSLFERKKIPVKRKEKKRKGIALPKIVTQFGCSFGLCKS
jgi:hypothetical protein